MVPRQRSPERDQAKEIYIQHNGEIQLTVIADRLKVSEGTVRGWKAKDGWDAKPSGTARSKKNTERSEKIRSVPKDKKERSKTGKKIPSNNADENSAVENEAGSKSGTPAKTNTKKRGGQPGNNNAYGNKGGLGASLGNAHAVKTNEYRNLFFKGANIELDDTKRAVLEMPFDKLARQLLLIDTLTYREMLILEEMRQLKEHPSGMIIESVTKNKGTTTNAYTNRNKSEESWAGNSTTEDVDMSTHVARSEAERRDRLGEALSRTQGRLQKAIEVWHKMEMDAERAEIDRAKLELQRQRISGQIDLDGLLDEDDAWVDLDE